MTPIGARPIPLSTVAATWAACGFCGKLTGRLAYAHPLVVGLYCSPECCQLAQDRPALLLPAKYRPGADGH